MRAAVHDHRKRGEPESETGPGRLLAAGALAYLAFVVYGSLVPWHFRAVPWETALARYREMPYLDLGIGSRADWVANILLFIPLVFLLMAWLARDRGAAARTAVALGVLVLAGALSLGIEFVQIFFPPRTVSRNDVAAEWLGALIGLGAWLWLGGAVERYVRSWRGAVGREAVAGRVLWIYLAVVFGYNVLPLDLTVSPVELYHKWQEGKIALVPFRHPQGEGLLAAYNVLADVATWIPVAFLLLASGRRSAGQAWWLALLGAAVLEVLQLFVYSRVTDTTDLVSAAAGAGIGVWLGRRWNAARGASISVSASGHGPGSPRLWLWLGAAVLWSAVLLGVFWYPFEFDLHRQILRERAALMLEAPFTTYYFGTEFRAVTEVLHKLAFFAPLGVALALARSGLPPGALRPLFTAFACMLIAGVAVTVELGQVALPGKFPSLTDAVLETAGGVAGLWVALVLRRRLRPPPATRPARRRPSRRGAPRSARPRPAPGA